MNTLKSATSLPCTIGGISQTHLNVESEPLEDLHLGNDDRILQLVINLTMITRRSEFESLEQIFMLLLYRGPG
jgi:hypothetical protein